jgi:hypothetical protein
MVQVRYRPAWIGMMILLVLVALFFLLFSIFDQNLLFALGLAVLTALGLYFTLTALASGEITNEKITMRQVWGSRYEILWKDVKQVNFSAAHIKFSGQDKWLTVPLEGIQKKENVIDFVARQIETRKLPSKPLTGLVFMRLFKNCKIT